MRKGYRKPPFRATVFIVSAAMRPSAQTLTRNHGARRMQPAVKRYGGARSRLPSERGWPLLLFSRHKGKVGHKPLSSDISTIRIIHVELSAPRSISTPRL